MSSINSTIETNIHPCRFLSSSRGCKKGNDCSFSHDLNIVNQFYKPKFSVRECENYLSCQSFTTFTLCRKCHFDLINKSNIDNNNNNNNTDYYYQTQKKIEKELDQTEKQTQRQKIHQQSNYNEEDEYPYKKCSWDKCNEWTQYRLCKEHYDLEYRYVKRNTTSQFTR